MKYVPCPHLAHADSQMKAIQLVLWFLLGEYMLTVPSYLVLYLFGNRIQENLLHVLCMDVRLSCRSLKLCKDLHLQSPEARCFRDAQCVKSHIFLVVENFLIASVISCPHTRQHNKQTCIIYPPLVLHAFRDLCSSNNKIHEKNM